MGYKPWNDGRPALPPHAAHLLHEVAGHGALHDLAGALELLEEFVDFLQGGAGAVGDAFAAAAVENIRMLALVGGHGEDDRLDALEGVVGDVDVLDGLADSRDHRGEVLDVAHLLDLLDLLVEVPEGEFVLGELLLELAGLLLVELLLRLLHEGDDIAHAEDAVGDAVRVEDVERLHLFAGGDELDGLADDGLDGKGRTAAGVAVHLGEDHAVEVEPLVKMRAVSTASWPVIASTTKRVSVGLTA